MRHVLLLSLWLSVESFAAHIQEFSAPITQDQTLTLKLSSWKIGGQIKIKNGQDDVAIFEFAQLSGQKVFARHTNIDSSPTLAVTHGGWPFGATPRAVELQLTNSPTAWEIRVNGQRHPWLDFKRSGGGTQTTGYEVVNLQTSSPPVAPGSLACNTKCASSIGSAFQECQCNSRDCYYLGPPNGGVRECSFRQESGFTCCTGTPSLLDIDTIQAGQIVEVVEKTDADPTYINRACASVDASGTCGDIQKMWKANGKPAIKCMVMEKERSANNALTGRVRVHFPEPVNANLIASPWMFVLSSAVETTVSMDPGAPGVTFDSGNAQVKQFDSRNNSGASSIQYGQYIVKVEQDSRTQQFTPSRLATMVNSGQRYTMVVSDAPRLLAETSETCQSRSGWTDSSLSPANCLKYAGTDVAGGRPWCTKFGLMTPDFRVARCSGVSNCNFDTYAKNSISALDACCACGGGTPTWQSR